MTQPKTTSLLATHQAAGARLVEFAGYRMPLQYSGIVDEHHTVRKAAGLFDVSHMGEITFRGPGAAATVDKLVTNAASALGPGEALYTPVCYADGGIVDDCLVYRRARDEFLLIVNASNVKKDYEWFLDHRGSDCAVENVSDAYALLALQGPHAAAIWASVAGQRAAQIERFAFAACEAAGVSCTAARTGYTGEDGFELLCEQDDAPTLWSALIEAGWQHGIKPCGLGARDTLRLEARLLLYGNDIDATTTPLEAGLGWTVKLDSKDFIGKQALVMQRREGIPRKLVCLLMRSRGIARHGHPIHLSSSGDDFGPAVGHVTSGTKSPTLNQAIALGYVPHEQAKVGTKLVVAVRGKPVEAEVVRGPFYKTRPLPPASQHT